MFCVLDITRCATLNEAPKSSLNTLQSSGCVYEHFLLSWIEVSMPLALAVDVKEQHQTSSAGFNVSRTKGPASHAWNLTDDCDCRRHWLVSFHVGPVFKRLSAEESVLRESSVPLSVLHLPPSLLRATSRLHRCDSQTLECVAC